MILIIVIVVIVIIMWIIPGGPGRESLCSWEPAGVGRPVISLFDDNIDI